MLLKKDYSISVVFTDVDSEKCRSQFNDLHCLQLTVRRYDKQMVNMKKSNYMK